MLVLTRRAGESIVIGDPARPIVTVLIVAISAERVRVGITASKEIPVNRHQIAEEIVQSQGNG
jgi:carbon storage regulator CsrA